MLKARLSELLPKVRDEIKTLTKEHGNVKISDVTVEQAYGGMRGVKSLVCDTSEVPPDKGLLIRNIPVAELVGKLPEEVFYLLCTGELPSADALTDLQADIRARSTVPSYVWKMLEAMPKDAHPMAMVSAAIVGMEHESIFRKRYEEGMKKDEYWVPMLEDALTLIARIPEIAAGIYRMKLGKARIDSDASLDWAANYANMLGVAPGNKDFMDMMRLYMVLHSDHENGNVSAMACHTVGSALSDIYYAVSAGLNGLAGPLHGLANQEVLRFVLDLREHFKGVPTDENLRKFVWDRLNGGQVVPGYGHGVLRVTDPRFTAFLAYGKKVCPNDDVYRLVDRLFEIVPKVLMEQGKAKDPWPNVDAASGALLWHFGLKEFNYYTVLFSVSRILGVSAQLILNRAIGAPIVRPKSIPTKTIKKIVEQSMATA